MSKPTTHRAIRWELSGSTRFMIDDLDERATEERLAFLRSSLVDHGARLCTVEIHEVDEDRPTGPNLSVALAAGTVSSPMNEQPEER